MAGRLKNQSSLLDVDLSDDEELAEAVATAFENQDAADAARKAKKQVKAILVDRHADAINTQQDGEHSGYIRVNGIRFAAKRSHKDKRTIPEKEEPASDPWVQMTFDRAPTANAAGE